MNRLGSLAYGAAVLAIALLCARDVIGPGAYLYQRLTSPNVELALAGWLIATSGPLLSSISLWRWRRRLQPLWMWHLLFIPCAIVMFRAGESILFRAAGVPDGDSIEGYTLLAASGFLILTLLVHAGALVALGASRFSRRANAR
jgi:hypothetical protein